MADIASRPAFVAGASRGARSGWRSARHRPAPRRRRRRSSARASRQVPPPFGLAGNGLIAWSLDGDIYTADPVTGESRPRDRHRPRAIDCDPCSRRTGRASRSVAASRGRADPADGSSSWPTADGDEHGSSPSAAIPVDDARWSSGRRIRRSLLVDAPGRCGDLALRRRRAPPRRPSSQPRTTLYLRAVPAAGRDAGPASSATPRPGTHHSLRSRSPRARRLSARRRPGASASSAAGALVARRVAGRLRRRSRRRRRHAASATSSTPTAPARRQIAHAPGVWYDIDPTWSPDGTQDRVHPLRAGRRRHWVVRPIGHLRRRDGEVDRDGPAGTRGAGAAPVPRTISSARTGEGFFVEWSPDAHVTARVRERSDGTSRS